MLYFPKGVCLGWRRQVVAVALTCGVVACQPRQPRLEQLEATQQQQVRELADLRQAVAERDEKIAQLSECVDNLEGAVYEPDSADYGDVPHLSRL